MAQVVFSPEALADLERLTEFLIEKSPEAAVDTLGLVLGATRIPASHPMVGRRVEGEMRELVISRGNSGHLGLYVFDAAAMWCGSCAYGTSARRGTGNEAWQYFDWRMASGLGFSRKMAVIPPRRNPLRAGGAAQG